MIHSTRRRSGRCRCAGISQESRVFALAITAASRSGLEEAQFDLLLNSLAAENAVTVRSAATDALTKVPLSSAQLKRLCTAVEASGPLEINQLLQAFSRTDDDAIALKLLVSLHHAAALPSVRVDSLRMALEKRGPEVQQAIDALEPQVNVNAPPNAGHRIEELLPQMAGGNVRRGHAVFQSSKAGMRRMPSDRTRRRHVRPRVVSHRGNPDGARFAGVDPLPKPKLRSQLRAGSLVTTDGRTINGTIRDESEKRIRCWPRGQIRKCEYRAQEVEQIEPSTVSIMPGGLEGQLTTEELADLSRF